MSDSELQLEARYAGELLALRLALGVLFRHIGGAVRDNAKTHIDTHLAAIDVEGIPDPLALAMFDTVAEQDAFMKAYRSVLNSLFL